MSETTRRSTLGVTLLAALLIAQGCDGPSPEPIPLQASPPSPDLRVGLEAGVFDAEEAAWNLRLVSTTPPPEVFVGATNSDLAFTGSYAIQGNYNGIQVWDISDPESPANVKSYVCPASQSDVSVYGDLLFVSGEGLSGRLDCGDEGVEERVSHHRLRGIRIFDISDIANPQYIHNVQTCRGSHTHTVLKHPQDDENVYIYVSGSAGVRPAEELPGCVNAPPDEDPNSALFRIEVIRVPLADPTAAEIVTSPRIFEGLEAPPVHGQSAADLAEVAEAEAEGAFVVSMGGSQRLNGQRTVLPSRYIGSFLEAIVSGRGGEGEAAAEDSTALREMLARLDAGASTAEDSAVIGPLIDMVDRSANRERTGPTQCHDITVYPAIGLAGGACGGYGLLLDISDPVDPRRIAAVADSNFSYWHSATFNNDGSSVMFTDEWGGGGAPKCREGDPMEWGANAAFTIESGELVFKSYFKIPAPQTSEENCVAHNGSLIPVPGRDIMIQGWYQGGISLIDWTDPANPVEIGYFDRGPVNPNEMEMGGSWSVYWYNGLIVNSEIKRGLDIFELVPNELLSQNEIDAANSVVLAELNSQGQPIFEWPATPSLALAYADQLERSGGLSASIAQRVRDVVNGGDASDMEALAQDLPDRGAEHAAAKVSRLAQTLEDLAGA